MEGEVESGLDAAPPSRAPGACTNGDRRAAWDDPTSIARVEIPPVCLDQSAFGASICTWMIRRAAAVAGVMAGMAVVAVVVAAVDVVAAVVIAMSGPRRDDDGVEGTSRKSSSLLEARASAWSPARRRLLAFSAAASRSIAAWTSARASPSQLSSR